MAVPDNLRRHSREDFPAVIVWDIMIAYLYKWLCYLASRFLYGPWSRLCRWLFERKYKKQPDDLPWPLTRVLAFFQGCKWCPDPWYYLDAISKPEKFYETKQGDCDEFACFAGTVMEGPCYIMSVTWYDSRKGEKTFHGHNICVFQAADKGWRHVSNWGFYTEPHEELLDLAMSIPPEGTIPCSYAIRDVDTLKWLAGQRL